MSSLKAIKGELIRWACARIDGHALASFLRANNVQTSSLKSLG